MKTLTFSFLISGFAFVDSMAQQIFIPYGKITYEKRINMQRTAATWNVSEEVKGNTKKYHISEWELYFNQNKSNYKAKKKEPGKDNSLGFLAMTESNNELFSDHIHRSRIIKRDIMGEIYLLKDTIPQLSWKILPDLRTIAGYECRKAIGIMNDTVYVVAFYSEQILLQGGPEGFSGLPGMILGLAIPRFNTTWFAKEIDAYITHEDQVVAPIKGRKTENDKDLQELLEIYSRYGGNKREMAAEIRKKLFGFLL